MNPAPVYLVVSLVIIVVSLPLVFRKIKMNGIYGIRIPEAFKSEERWYQINRFGGILFLVWGVVLGFCGGIGLMLPSSCWTAYSAISLGLIFGGLILVVVAVFVYAATTRKD